MYTLVKALKALSDETRLRIICLLLERECCVCEVMQAMEISQTRASRNLTLLYDAGFLNMRKEGLWTLYSVKSESGQDYFLEMIEAAKNALKDNKEILADRERLKKARRIGPACLQKGCSAVTSNK